MALPMEDKKKKEMKKIIIALVLISIFLVTNVFAEKKDFVGDINKRIIELEKILTEKTQYLQQLQQEIQNTTTQLVATQGALSELKKLLPNEKTNSVNLSTNSN